MGFTGMIKPSPKVESSSGADLFLSCGGILRTLSRADGNKVTQPFGPRYCPA